MHTKNNQHQLWIGCYQQKKNLDCDITVNYILKIVIKVVYWHI